MKARALWCGVLLLAVATSGSGQSMAEPGFPLPEPAPLMSRTSADRPAGPTAPEPGSALEYLERQIRDNPPPLEPPGPSLVGPILGGLASAGCAVGALTPTFTRWGAEEREGEYIQKGLGWGSLQGLLLNGGFGKNLAALIFPAPDMRAEYGNLLDLSQGERERRAYQILRKRAQDAKRQRVAGALLIVGATALPAGVYYLGSAIAGPNRNVKDFGIGYVLGIALGSLPSAALALARESPEERILARLEAGQGNGGTP